MSRIPVDSNSLLHTNAFHLRRISVITNNMQSGTYPAGWESMKSRPLHGSTPRNVPLPVNKPGGNPLQLNCKQDTLDNFAKGYKTFVLILNVRNIVFKIIYYCKRFIFRLVGENYNFFDPLPHLPKTKFRLRACTRKQHLCISSTDNSKIPPDDTYYTRRFRITANAP